MATFTVTTAADAVNAGDGVLSLREAVQQANATAQADTIQFANALEGQTLGLTQGELRLSENTAIDGDADNNGSQVEISAGGQGRVLLIDGTAIEVSVTDLAIANGRVLEGNGGGCFVAEGNGLTLTECTLRNNEVGESYSSFGAGGAVFGATGSRITVLRSSLSENSATNGAGIAARERSTVVVTDSDLARNDAHGEGGAIYVGRFDNYNPTGSRSSLLLERTTVSDNAGGNFYYGGGGGLRLSNTQAIIRDSAIVRNAASESGGGIYANQTSLEMVNSTLADNSVTQRYGYGIGGGLNFSQGELSLASTTVTDNFADGASTTLPR